MPLSEVRDPGEVGRIGSELLGKGFSGQVLTRLYWLAGKVAHVRLQLRPGT